MIVRIKHVKVKKNLSLEYTETITDLISMSHRYMVGAHQVIQTCHQFFHVW